MSGCLRALSRWPVLYGYKSVSERRRALRLRWSDSDVIAYHADLSREVRAGGVGPAFNVVIPIVRRPAQVRRDGLFSNQARYVRRRQQSGNLHRQRERRIARVFFPTILLRNRAVADQEPSRATNQIPPALQVAQRRRAVPPQAIHKQNGKRSL